jgi:hypothetical protein
MFAAMPFASAASSIGAGNDATSRPHLDSRNNFTIIDKNHPVSDDGALNAFKYYAGNTNSFRFVIVDGSNVVKYVSPQVTPSATGVGTFMPSSPVSVQKDWNIGLYFPSTGTVPFEAVGTSAPYTLANSGQPAVGGILSYDSSAQRTYSFVATGSIDTDNGNDKKIKAGNDGNSRPQLDSYSNFTVIDTNNPVDQKGELKKFSYWAGNKNPFRFVVVNEEGKVKWVSEQITPKKVGQNNYKPGSPVAVKKSWNIGMYFSKTGTIPFESTGKDAKYTANNSGLPTVGSNLSIAGNTSRTYSFLATGKTDKVKKDKHDKDCRCDCNCDREDNDKCNCEEMQNAWDKFRSSRADWLKMLRERCSN